jgi:hypothetical protein
MTHHNGRTSNGAFGEVTNVMVEDIKRRSGKEGQMQNNVELGVRDKCVCWLGALETLSPWLHGMAGEE